MSMSSTSGAVFIYPIVANLDLFRSLFTLGNIKKVYEAKSGKYGGWAIITITNITNKQGCVSRCDAKAINSSATIPMFFSYYQIWQTFSCFFSVLAFTLEHLIIFFIKIEYRFLGRTNRQVYQSKYQTFISVKNNIKMQNGW